MIENSIEIQPSKIKARQHIDERNDEKFKEAKELIIESIRMETEGNDEWVKITSKKLSQDAKIPANRQRGFLTQIRNHPNIISQFSTTSRPVPEELRPIAFKWVALSEKKAMGFKGQSYKHIDDVTVERLEEIYKNGTNGLIVNDILAIYDMLIEDGARDGWIEFDIIKLSARSLQHIETTKAVIQDFIKNELLFLGTFVVDKKTIQACRLLIDKSLESTIREEHTKETVTLYRPLKDAFSTPRIFTEKATQRIKELSSKKIPLTQRAEQRIIDTVKKNDNFVNIKQDSDSVNSSDPGEKSLKSLDKISTSVKIVEGKVTEVLKSFQGELENILKEDTEKNQRSFLAFSKMDAELKRLNDEIDKRDEEIKHLKSKLEKTEKQRIMFRDFSDEYLANAQDNLIVMSGSLMSSLEQFSSQPLRQLNNQVVVAKFKKEMMDIVGETTRMITCFKPESKFPPDLK